MVTVLRIVLIALAAALAHADNAQAQNAEPVVNRAPFSQSYVTRHVLRLPDRTITFTATAENLVFTEQRGFPRAEVTYVAFTKDSTDPASRPVAFVVNGGPGASSAYLNLLAIGPWRTSLGGARNSASLTTLHPNRETWLDFTDLVFIDPPGTGYSRVTGGERMRQHYYSVGGDIDGLASFIHRWLVEKERHHSPIYFVGASYGGFRAPLLARKMQEERPKGFSGLILVSPALDFDWLPFGRSIQYPWISASILPSLVAMRTERDASATPELLQQAEVYASGEYITDLLRGAEDAEAVERIAHRVEQLTGVPASLMKHLKGRAGRIDVRRFLGDLEKKSAQDPGHFRVYSSRSAVEYSEDYDLSTLSRIADAEMEPYFKNLLKFQTSEKYVALNNELNPTWRWNNGRYGVESLSSLERAMNTDAQMRVLIAHGTSDMTTPYFATKMLVSQMEVREPGRLGFKLYGGNHTFYTREESRKAFRNDAKVFFEAGRSTHNLTRP